ncbi:hypothetical protein IAR50_000983 [Cryptococcus sp. DSM 104548]
MRDRRDGVTSKSVLEIIFSKLGKGRVLGGSNLGPQPATATAAVPALAPVAKGHETTTPGRDARLSRPPTAQGHHTPQTSRPAEGSSPRHRPLFSQPPLGQHPIQRSFHFATRAHPTITPVVSSPAPRDRDREWERGSGSRHAHISFTPSTRPEAPYPPLQDRERLRSGSRGEKEGRRPRAATIPGTTRPAGVPALGDARSYHRANTQGGGQWSTPQEVSSRARHVYTHAVSAPPGPTIQGSGSKPRKAG